MTTTKLNSIEKIRTCLRNSQDIYMLDTCYRTTESLLFRYKRVLNIQKAKEASQMMEKIRMIMIEKQTQI